MEYERFLHDWLDRHPPGPKEEAPPTDAELRAASAERRRGLMRMKPQGKLDLHGLTAEEAIAQADVFLKASKADGLRKVLIVHGKGNHSPGGQAVLRSSIRDFVRTHPLSQEVGIPDRSQGGDGAIWVLLR